MVMRELRKNIELNYPKNTNFTKSKHHALAVADYQINILQRLKDQGLDFSDVTTKF